MDKNIRLDIERRNEDPYLYDVYEGDIRDEKNIFTGTEAETQAWLQRYYQDNNLEEVSRTVGYYTIRPEDNHLPRSFALTLAPIK